MSTYMVTSTADSGAGSLRQAITDANNHAGADAIHFAIGSGAKTITPSKGLPGLGDDTTLDATTQPGFAGKPIIEINGSNAGGADGIRISGSRVTVRGLIINRFGGSGMLVMGKGHNTIAGNWIGTTSNGLGAAGNSAHGILLQSSNNHVGGTSASDRNVVSANGQAGVFLYTSSAQYNVVEGNYVGTDANGAAKLGNKNGVQMNGAANNIVGGIGASHRNVISGNAQDGVIAVGSGAKLNAIQGNYIGVDATGSKRLGNGWYGVEISRNDNVVGGSALGAGNVISANGKGGVVLFLATASGNRVQGNFIGTDASGTKDLGNTGRGMEFTNGAHDNLVGGDRGSQKNVISGNDNGGVGIYSGSSMNYVQKNYIGTDASGANALGNTGAGITITDSAGTNIIGGRRAGNVVSANNQGIAISSNCKATVIQGNYIGTDVSGTKDLGNTTDGIYASSSGNAIGGKKSGTGNLISGNGGDGIRLANNSGSFVGRNIIGLGAYGIAIANGGNGVLLSNASGTPVRGNVIACNTGDGVKVSSGSKNAIVSNSIWGNGAMGIRVATTTKQAGPSISSVKNTGGKTQISGSVTSKANSSLYVEFFATSGDGEGKTLIGAINVKCNASGKGSFSLGMNPLNPGTAVTATVTAADGSTSEFAASKTV